MRASPAARECNDKPIFVLSAGWRSGSTLLQRMIMEHNPGIIMWGEPFDHSNIYDGMASQFRPFTSEWPFERFFLSTRNSANLSNEWVANLYPDVDYLINGHRAFFEGVFGASARAMGRLNWGIKEVRLTVDHAKYFRALYPNCKIIFLYRNPHNSYLSYRRLDAAWFRSWPYSLVKTPLAFGRHWSQTTYGFIKEHREVNGFLIRYEDLNDPDSVMQLSQYLGWAVSCSSKLQRRDVDDTQQQRTPLPWIDRKILDYATREVRKLAGYP